MYTPHHLYHYTSIDTLDKIIKSRKLKLNRLDKADDLNEGKTHDLGNLGMYIFVSCWTDTDSESIPLWNMYSDGMKGVRIKMHSNIIEPHFISSDSEISLWAKKKFFIEKGTPYLVPIEEMHGQDFIVGPYPRDFLYKVEYSNNSNKIFPESYKYENNYHIIKFGLIGRVKRAEWEFQSEWRYRFTVLPAPPPPKRSYDKYKEETGKEFEVLCKETFEKRIVSKDYFLLNIKENAINDMEIMLGPKCSNTELEAVKNIIENSGYKLKLKFSSLTGQIK
ncbi:MAG: DUF2971 domain-containing protein [Planctomycetia bacterium]|nr:DUF2971 domain-containing protein [Planctomycetia bacterium]